jgi:polyhydroxyalkanoic acid synthase PhaR subunit
VSTPSEPAERPNDPFELWRQIYAANERAWNAAIERSMANPAFAEAQGKLLETFLNVQKTFREQVRTYLEAVNVPSREDVARLGELIVGLEEKVDQLSDRVVDLEAAVGRLSSRTDRPKAEGSAPARRARKS